MELSQAWAARFGLPARYLEAMAAQVEALGRPEGVIPALERLLERTRDVALAEEFLAEPSTQTALARLAYAAPYLIRYLYAHPAPLERGALAELERPPALLPFSSQVASEKVALLEPEGLQQTIRHWKYENYLRLTAQDLLGRISTEETCAGISRLADGMIRVAYEHAFAGMVREYGLPVRKAGGLAAGAVIGMGKLGGGELNYASDVDLIFIHDGEEAGCRALAAPPTVPIDPASPAEEPWRRWETLATDGGAPPREKAITTGEFHERLARRVHALVSAQTNEGIGFRVDLDLRPMGKSGLLSPSLAFLSQYYDVHGREWERTALLKARHVAGSPRVFQEFQALIRPFVYRRYLDYGAIEGIIVVKRDIDRHHHAGLARNLKLGRGGIRENEFFVQALQLLYGGKEPRLQVTSHAQAVRRLIEAEVLTPELGESLLSDYWLLRRVENRLQMVNEAQTQELPGQEAERLRIFTDFRPDFPRRLAQVETELEAARRRTAERFAGLLSEGAAGEQPDAEVWRRAVREGVPAELQEKSLSRIAGLLDGLMRTRVGEGCVLKVERLLARPELYQQGTEPAFPHWLEFLERVGNRNTILALLEAHPPVVARISAVFAEGGRLASQLIRHPEFAESFIGLATGPEHLARLAERARDEEEFILELQGAKSRAVLRILTAYLEDSEEGHHHAELSNLADATVEACLHYAWKRTVERYGAPQPSGEGGPSAGFAVLAMGKLGSREMRFGSDLDLVFCYREDGATVGGASHFEFYTRLAQTLSNLLTAPTQFGRLYELDHRLRPFGRKGVLVPSLAAYRNFLASADVWNFQALTRIRPLAGERRLAGQLIDAVVGAWREKAVSEPELATAVHEMLHRLVQEHGPTGEGEGAPLGLKYALGGMIGFEFLQQHHFLRAKRRGRPDWGAVPDDGLLARLRPGYITLSALDERLSLHEERFRHEVSPDHFRRLRAIRERWRWEEVRACLLDQGRAIEEAFQEAMR